MDYDRSRATALRLIRKFGNDGQAVFTRTASSGFDPIEGTENQSATTYTAYVVVPPMTDRTREEARTLGFDVEFLLPMGFEPRAGDYVSLPGRSGSFVVVSPIDIMAPDGDPIMYTVRARKGT